MKIVRGRLSASSVVPPNQRVDPTTNIFQITPDGGTTWTDAPGSDPRIADVYLLPPLTPYPGIHCDVAARMTAQLKDTLDIFLASGDAAQFATGALALLVATVPLVGWFVDLFLFIGLGLVDVGQSNIEDAFTEAVYDSVRCTFDCRLDSNGQMTQAELDDAYDEIKTNNPGVVANVIDLLRFFFGDVPMNNAGVVRDETGDCSDCGCCPDGYCTEIDFTASNGGFTSNLGTWSAGVGWVHGTVAGDGKNYRGVWIHKTIEAGNIKSIEIEYTRTTGSFFSAQTDRIWHTTDTGANWIATHAAGSTPIPFVYVGDLNGKTVIGLTLTCGFSTPASGALTVTKITITGDDCTVAPGYTDCL